MKVVTFLIPSFRGLRLERLGAWPPFCVLNTKKKNGLQIYIMTLGATATSSNDAETPPALWPYFLRMKYGLHDTDRFLLEL